MGYVEHFISVDNCIRFKVSVCMRQHIRCVIMINTFIIMIMIMIIIIKTFITIIIIIKNFINESAY